MNAPNTSPLEPLLEMPAPKRKRKMLVLGGIALGAIAAWQAWAHWPTSAQPLTYQTAAIARADIRTTVSATGTLSPVVQVEVGSQVSGRIAELLVDYNSEVKKDQVIARLETDQLESSLTSASARLSSANADYRRAKAVAENAKAQYDRTKRLADAGAVSKSEAESALLAMRQADASLTAARAAITVARASRDQAKVDLTFATIKSPIDGIVISRAVDTGQTVAASLSAPVLFTIAEDLRKMELHTSVSESDVGQLKPGMPVEFTVDAFPSQTFTGTVKQVRFEAKTESNVVTYDAVVSVQNDGMKLRPGMTANATFITQAASDVIAVPNKALSYRPADFQPERRLAKPTGQNEARGQRGQQKPTGETESNDNSEAKAGAAKARPRPRNVRRVFIKNQDGTLKPLRITVGITDGAYTEVTGGALKPGDEVIIGDSTNGASANAATPRGNQRRSNRRRPPMGPF